MGNRKSGPVSTLLTDESVRSLAYYVQCSPEFVRQAHTKFLQVTGDGRLSKKDFVRLYEEAYPGIDIRPLTKLIFNMYDTDESKTITFDEFFIPNVLFNSSDCKHRAKCLFRILDYDENQRICKKELTNALKGLYLLRGIPVDSNHFSPATKAQQILQRMDFNGDATIDEGEFVFSICNDTILSEILSFDYRIPIYL